MLASECWSSRVVIGIWRRKRRGGRLYLPPVQTELKTQVILFSFKAIGIFSLFWNCIYFESLWGVIYFLRWIWIADSNITFILLSVDCVGGVRFSLFWVYFSLAISLSLHIHRSLSLSSLCLYHPPQPGRTINTGTVALCDTALYFFYSRCHSWPVTTLYSNYMFTLLLFLFTI